MLHMRAVSHLQLGATKLVISKLQCDSALFCLCVCVEKRSVVYERLKSDQDGLALHKPQVVGDLRILHLRMDASTHKSALACRVPCQLCSI